MVADWGNKADHIDALSEDLSLGLDSFVFIDDNAVERSLVRTVLPEVAVPDFPNRPELLSTWFLTDVVPSLFPRRKCSMRIAQRLGSTNHVMSAAKLRSQALKTFWNHWICVLRFVSMTNLSFNDLAS